MVNAFTVLDLTLRDNDDAGIVLKERLPPVLPVRLEGITRAQYLYSLCDAPPDQLLRLHEPRDGNRVRGVDVEVGRYEHGYVPDWFLPNISWGMGGTLADETRQGGSAGPDWEPVRTGLMGSGRDTTEFFGPHHPALGPEKREHSSCMNGG